MGIFIIAIAIGYVALIAYILYQAYTLDRMREELKRNKPPF